MNTTTPPNDLRDALEPTERDRWLADNAEPILEVMEFARSGIDLPGFSKNFYRDRARIDAVREMIGRYVAMIRAAKTVEVGDTARFAGVDGQVSATFVSLTEDQRANPEWLWYEHDEATLTFGRWQKTPSAAPCIRGDLALRRIHKPPEPLRPPTEAAAVIERRGDDEPYAFVKLVGRLDHTGDDGYSWPEPDEDDARHELDDVIAKARDIMATSKTLAPPPPAEQAPASGGVREMVIRAHEKAMRAEGFSGGYDAGAVVDACLAALPDRGGGWRGIESAPRDGTFVLLYNGEPEWAGAFECGGWFGPDDDGDWWSSGGPNGGLELSDRFTHWRPLPSPPQDAPE